MKINGEEFSNKEAIFGPVVIVRGGKKFGIFAQPVWNFKEFDAICQRPEPPVTAFSKHGKTADLNSPKYKEELAAYARRRWGYMVFKSLEPSKIEIPGVTLDDPASLENVEEALQQGDRNPDGFSHFEFAEVMRLIDEANSLDSEKLEANRESFLSETAATPDAG